MRYSKIFEFSLQDSETRRLEVTRTGRVTIKVVCDQILLLRCRKKKHISLADFLETRHTRQLRELDDRYQRRRFGSCFLPSE
mmetsp:Transcript_10138/g.20486  ORF Transcript_10138/g.20486 Transcript_10138/m.20486 type:complete len:82 (-) Transcript_10138:961-1206(-)